MKIPQLQRFSHLKDPLSLPATGILRCWGGGMSPLPLGAALEFCLKSKIIIKRKKNPRDRFVCLEIKPKQVLNGYLILPGAGGIV